MRGKQIKDYMYIGNVRFDIGTEDENNPKCVYVRARMYHLSTMQDRLKFEALKRQIEGIIKSYNNKYFKRYSIVDYKVSESDHIDRLIKENKLKPEYTEVEVHMYPVRPININSDLFRSVIVNVINDLYDAISSKLDVKSYK